MLNHQHYIPVVLRQHQPPPHVSILTLVNLAREHPSAEDYEMRCREISALISRWLEISRIMSRFVGSLMDADFPLTSLIVAAHPPFTGKTTRQSNPPSPPTRPISLKITKPVSRGDDYPQLMKLWMVRARGSVMERARWAEEEGQGVVRPSNWL